MTREELMAHATEEADKIRDAILKRVSQAWSAGVNYERARAGRVVKVAHWVPVPGRRNHWKCSACGNGWGVPAMAMHYCPDCGAEMEADDE